MDGHPTRCPKCKEDRSLDVIQYTLVATGEVIEDNTCLGKYGFEVNAPFELEDQSTMDEIVACRECGAVFPMDELYPNDDKTAKLLVMVDGDLSPKFHLVKSEIGTRLQEADDAEAEAVIENGEGLIHSCDTAIEALEWAAQSGYTVNEELHFATT